MKKLIVFAFLGFTALAQISVHAAHRSYSEQFSCLAPTSKPLRHDTGESLLNEAFPQGKAASLANFQANRQKFAAAFNVASKEVEQIAPVIEEQAATKVAPVIEEQAATKVAPAKSSSKLKYFILATAIPAAYAAYVYYMNTLAGQNSNQPK